MKFLPESDASWYSSAEDFGQKVDLSVSDCSIKGHLVSYCASLKLNTPFSCWNYEWNQNIGSYPRDFEKLS